MTNPMTQDLGAVAFEALHLDECASPQITSETGIIPARTAAHLFRSGAAYLACEVPELV